jgi:hypothetical protein
MPRLLQSLLGLLAGLSNRLRATRHAPPPAPAGPEPQQEEGRRLPQKPPPYDLAKDTSTDNQKYLM